MAKEGSVAPKERINVTFKPATGNAQEELELPLKLLVLGDFTQRADDRRGARQTGVEPVVRRSEPPPR
jgi:type VI secretion system protein ImpB